MPGHKVRRWITSANYVPNHLDPEAKLFTAVLSQAVHDIFSDHVERIDKSQAIEFLTKDSYHLRLVCELAGRDPDYVRSKIRNKLLNGMDTR
tara:strand:+ start:138 stop:413 length:276 start_codon:yes stop_codon:yes gene_type:complete